jgi:hypothetical protein
MTEHDHEFAGANRDAGVVEGEPSGRIAHAEAGGLDHGRRHPEIVERSM